MAILTFPWNDIGQVSELTVTDLAHTIKHEFAGGYQASRAQATKMQKQFDLTWWALESNQWLSLVEFWRNVRGSADAFYFEYPREVYGVSPGFGGFGFDESGDPEHGFDIEEGYDADEVTHMKPIFLARFVSDSLQQKVLHNVPMGFDRWFVNTQIREVA